MIRECPFPQKEQLTKAEAKRRALVLNTHAYDGRAVHPYHCPAGGHHHVGHRTAHRWRRR